ncbi:UNVERIFIED_ORG: hypothetical protein BCL66_11158 [Martelella mediterranea]
MIACDLNLHRRCECEKVIEQGKHRLFDQSGQYRVRAGASLICSAARQDSLPFT